MITASGGFGKKVLTGCTHTGRATCHGTLQWHIIRRAVKYFATEEKRKRAAGG